MLAPSSPPPTWLAPSLRLFQKRADLPDDLLDQSLEGMIHPDLVPGDAMAWLAGLAARGESCNDFVRGALFLRQRMTRWDLPGDLVDACGTGGDGAGTFNISTVVSWVVAACGLRVAKHGNRAQSGTSGSSDLLEYWGLGSPADQERARALIEACGIVFCLAPRHHPALATLAPVRKRLGVRTLFNGLGPLCNPTIPKTQLIGLGFPDWIEPYSQAVAKLGLPRALVVHGTDGLDEISLGAPNAVRWIRHGHIEALTWTHADFGLPTHDRNRFRVESVAQSAAMAAEALSGRANPPRDIVLANAAALLWVAQKVTNLKEGVALAAQAIDSGRPRELMEIYRRECPNR